MMEPVALLSQQETEDNFPRNQWRKEGGLRRGIQKPNEPYYSIQEVCVQGVDTNGSHISIIL